MTKTKSKDQDQYEDRPKTPAEEKREQEIHVLEVAKRKVDIQLAEVELADKETRLREHEAMATFEELDLEAKEIEVSHLRSEHERYGRSDWDERRITFAVDIEPRSVYEASKALRSMHRLDPNADIEFIISSPGGDVMSGMALFDEMYAMSLSGGGTHKITTVVRGMAASMAAILSQVGDERVMGRESYMMIHEVSSLAFGKVGQIKDEINLLDKLSDRVTKIFVDRSGGKTKPAAFKKLWDRKDAWLTSEEALKHGFIDRIG